MPLEEFDPCRGVHPEAKSVVGTNTPTLTNAPSAIRPQRARRAPHRFRRGTGKAANIDRSRSQTFARAFNKILLGRSIRAAAETHNARDPRIVCDFRIPQTLVWPLRLAELRRIVRCALSGELDEGEGRSNGHRGGDRDRTLDSGNRGRRRHRVESVPVHSVLLDVWPARSAYDGAGRRS